VHNENTEVATALMQRLVKAGRTDIAAWTDRCPPWLEAEHVHRYGFFALKAGCRIYALHISTADGLDACMEMKRKGCPLTVETCPQYLLMTTDSPPGLLLKVNPPIRDARHNEALWRGDGWRIKGWPKVTVCRGTVVFEDGKVPGKPGHGRYLPRDPRSVRYAVEKGWDLPR
jgi:dihydroorotase-like cyclic amidohydrolase